MHKHSAVLFMTCQIMLQEQTEGMNESSIEFHIVATKLGVKLCEVVMLSSHDPHKLGDLKRGF